MRTQLPIQLALALLLVVPCARAAGQADGTPIFVSAAAPAGGDGSSWSTAFQELDSALMLAASQPQSGDVWVARGRYVSRQHHIPGDPRSASFLIAGGVRVHGGFRGDESSFAQRAGLFRDTLLDGDLGVGGSDHDNAYHVVRARGACVLDGFTLMNGNANVASEARGGGVLCEPNQGTLLRLSNCYLLGNKANQGGALHAMLATAEIDNCVFLRNEANNGGALFAITSSVAIWNSSFIRNSTRTGHGGALMFASIGVRGIPNARAMNCLFLENESTGNGGAVHLGGSQFSSGLGIFVACTFTRNSAGGSGGAISAITTTPTPALSLVRNSIVWGNSAVQGGDQLFGTQYVSHCDVQGGYPGTGNIDVDPQFVDPAAGNLRLAGGPCVDAGLDSFTLPDQLDLDGDGLIFEPTPFDRDRERRSVGNVDMGAFEFGTP